MENKDYKFNRKNFKELKSIILKFDLISLIFKCQSMDTHLRASMDRCSLDTVEKLSCTEQGNICLAKVGLVLHMQQPSITSAQAS